MPKISYVPKKFNADHTDIIDKANSICMEYVSQGLVLTLRQVYYQFVSRGYIDNNQASYNKLGNVLNDARLAGEIDWEFMIDRTRGSVERSRWDNPGTLLEQAAHSYHIDLWKDQGIRPMVFVEKDAAIGVIEGVCNQNDVPYLSCRGYPSSSELWSIAQKIRFYIECGDRVVVFHIGDHDPSGLDMTRDLNDRLSRFLYKDWTLTQGRAIPTPRTYGAIKAHMKDYMREVNPDNCREGLPFWIKRIALNLDQIRQYDPPPNFAKTTDARFQAYHDATGLEESWELDALDPNVLIGLIQNEIDLIRDEDKWDARVEQMERERLILNKMSTHYTPIVNLVSTL